MSDVNREAPERYKTTPYTGEGLRGAYKVFEDPDLVDLHQDVGSSKFQVAWSTGHTAISALEALGEIFSESSAVLTGKEEGTLALSRSQSPGHGWNGFTGDIEDVASEIHESGDRVLAFSLTRRNLVLSWGPQWPKTYHNIATNQVTLTLGTRSRVARSIIQQSMLATAMPGLNSSVDITLDELGEHFTFLKT